MDDDRRLPAHSSGDVENNKKGASSKKRLQNHRSKKKAPKAPPWLGTTSTQTEAGNKALRKANLSLRIKSGQLVGGWVARSLFFFFFFPLEEKQPDHGSSPLAPNPTHPTNPNLSSGKNRPPTQHPAAFNSDEQHPSLPFPPRIQRSPHKPRRRTQAPFPNPIAARQARPVTRPASQSCPPAPRGVCCSLGAGSDVCNSNCYSGWIRG